MASDELTNIDEALDLESKLNEFLSKHSADTLINLIGGKDGDRLKGLLHYTLLQEFKKDSGLRHKMNELANISSKDMMDKKLCLEMDLDRYMRTKMKYFIIDCGYTSRLVKKFDMELVVRFKDNENDIDNKIKEFIENDSVTFLDLKQGYQKFEEEDSDSAIVYPIMIIDGLWGEGVYINSKADKNEVNEVLKNIGNMYGATIFKNQDITCINEVVKYISELDFCAWYGNIASVRYMRCDGFSIGIQSIDSESG